MNTIVLLTSRRRRTTSSCMSRRISGSSAENGSSNSKMSGSVARARARPDSLLLAAAQLMRAVAAHLRQPDELQGLVGLASPRGLVDATHLETERDVVDERAVRQQAEVLEHHRHLVAAHVEQRVACRPW